MAPVLMGIAVALRAGVFHALAAAMALAGALLIQIGTNFANDYYDHVKGADAGRRLGPTRATQAGLVAPSAMRNAYLITFGLAGAVGVNLVVRAGWPILVIGVLAVAFGILYTGGPRPLGYRGLGDPLVLVFFGPVAVAGTYYVQAIDWSTAAAVAGLGPGLLSTALLSLNNLRDIVGDEAAGKRTLAVRFGPAFTKAEFTLCIVGAALVPVLLVAFFDGPLGAIAGTAACLFALPPLRAVLGWQPGDRLQVALAGVGRLLILYALAFSLGWWLWR